MYLWLLWKTVPCILAFQQLAGTEKQLVLLAGLTVSAPHWLSCSLTQSCVISFWTYPDAW